MVELCVIVTCDECGKELSHRSFYPPCSFGDSLSGMEGYEAECNDCQEKGAREARLAWNKLIFPKHSA